MMNKRLKYAFYTLLGVLLVSLISGILYLESEGFANSVKKMISERSPEKLGVVGDFSNLKLYFFPPGIGIASPKIKVSKENIAQIPIDGRVEARELRVSFAPIKLFAGVLEVSEVYVTGGAIQGTLYADTIAEKPKKKKESSQLSWKDLFEFQINGFRLEDTYLNLVTKLPGQNHEEITTELVVKNLAIKKTQIFGRGGFTSSATVSAVHVTPPSSFKDFPIHEANQMQWDIDFTDKGLKFHPFTADLSGIRFQIVGAINGNLLDEKAQPTIDGEVEAHSDLGIFFLTNLNNEKWQGIVDVKAKLSAQLKKIKETLIAQFTVKASNLHWKDVKAAKLESEGELDLKLKKLKLKSLQAEDDGSLKIGAVEIPLQFNEPFQGEVELSNADIHWLGGAVPKDVVPIDGKISGKISAQFFAEKNKSWRLHTEDNLIVDQFGLKSTKHQILKPLFPVKIKGSADLSPKGLDFKDLTVGLRKTQLDVSGGVHPSAEGFAMSGKGHIDLKEFKAIAENDISGEGEIEVNVHGPTESVIIDFITKIKDASYLGMRFGNVDGKITYDDGISELRFSTIHANYKNTFYSLSEGLIDLSGGDDIHLPFDIHSGRIEDLAYILDNLVHKISWYPVTLKGEIHGNVIVGGKVSMPKLKVLGEIEGSDWVMLGERARRVKMNLGYDEGNYFAKNVVITKTSGSIKGDIEYAGANDSIIWNLSTENLSFADVDFLDRLEIPAKSKIELKSHGEGPLNRLKSKTEGRLYGTEFKGESFEPSSINLEMGESTLRANISVFGDKLSSQIKYALIPKQPSSFRIDLNDFDFSPALLILNPKLLDDPDLVGEVSGHVDLNFLSTQSEFARGNFQIKSYRLEKSGFVLQLEDPVNVPIELGYFHFPQSRIKFNQAELVMGGEGKRGDIDFSLRGQIDLAITELFSSSIAKANGNADTEIRIRGPIKDLSVNGDLNFSNARILMKWLQTPFEGIDGSIRLSQGLISVESIDAYLGEEVFTMNGKIQTYTDRFPTLDLHAQFEDNKVKMAPLDLIQVRGPISIEGTAPPYVISGNLEVPQALWARSFGGDAGGTTTRGDRFLPIDQEKQLSNNLFKLDVSVNAPQGFTIRNEIIDAEFRGKVKLVGYPDHPSLLGEGSLVQGKVLFRDRPFILENVKVDFDDPIQLNPKFNASAVSEINQYKVRVLAYGRANSWKAEFTSTPFLAENEIFSLLASGYTSADASRYKIRDRSYVSQGEAASVILHSMDFSKDVQNKTGFQFDVQEAIDSTYAASVFKPQNLSDNVASPKLVLKRQLGRDVWFSVGSTVGVGTENQKEVNAEYKLTPVVSVLGVWNDTEDSTLTTQQITSFGLDLKFNKRFK
jgi:hypothetical protein